MSARLVLALGCALSSVTAYTAAPAQTGAAAWVEEHTRSVEADRRRQLHAPWPAKVVEPAKVGGALAHLGQQVTKAILDCRAV